jgi:chromosome segregation ATPase
MTSPSIETDLGKILERIEQTLTDFRKEANQRFDRIEERLTKLEVGQAEIRGDLKAVQGEAKTIQEEVKATNGRFWALVAFLGAGLLGGLGTTVGIIIKVFLFPSDHP